MNLMSILEAVEHNVDRVEIEEATDYTISFYDVDENELVESLKVMTSNYLFENTSEDFMEDNLMILEGQSLKNAATISDDAPGEALSKTKLLAKLQELITKTDGGATAKKIAKISYITKKGTSGSETIYSRPKSYFNALSTDPKDKEASEKRKATNEEKGQQAFVCSADGTKVRTIVLNKIVGLSVESGSKKTYKIKQEGNFPDISERIEVEAKVVSVQKEKAINSVIEALSSFDGLNSPKKQSAEEIEKGILKQFSMLRSAGKSASDAASTMDKDRREKGEESPSESASYTIKVLDFHKGEATVEAALSLIKLGEAVGAELPLNAKGAKVFSKATPNYEDHKKEILAKIGSDYTITARGTAWTKANFKG